MTEWIVPLSATSLGEEEAAAAAEVVRSGWLTQGPRVEQFEKAFAAMVGVKHAMAVANCTLGLELGLEALGVTAGDEVIVPSLTFVATANAVRRLGAIPVFADVASDDDLTLDPLDVERKVSSRTRAVCPMHYAGYPARIRASGVAGAVPVIEDCAHAPGAGTARQRCGAMGAIGAFSFFGNKNMTTGEGGMLTTDRDDLADIVRAKRSHGMTSNTWDRHRGHAYSYDVQTVGTNARLDEVRAAIGLIQLGRLERGNANRRERVAQYRELLGGVDGLSLPFAARDPQESAHHLMVALLPRGIDRIGVMGRLREARVQTSIHYPPTHQFAAYRAQTASLPVTERVAQRILTLPLFSTMTADQVARVCDSLMMALRA